MHLSDELLSAYADGELPPATAVAAAAHLRACAGCAETVQLFGGLDARLSSTPALGCSAALTVVSAELDGELDREETAIARLHLSSCADCRNAVLRWSVVDQAVAALPPSRPSARVDAAIAALGREPRVLRLPRVTWPVPALAVAVAVAVLLVVNLSLVPSGAPGPVALIPAAEQSVLNQATGTLYVLHPENGTVAALDAQTLESRGVISVGGRPTALALNTTLNTLIVLDATAKTLTEIDCASNAVTSSTAVTWPGTPTSLQVDPSGQLVVTSVVAPAPSVPVVAAAPAGVVSVFNGGTKKLETVKSVDVAAASVVWQPNGKRALLVSPDGATLVETTTWQTIAKYGGGLAAVFSANGTDFAILSSTTKDGAVVTRQNGMTVVGGAARAIAALPDGGFAVLSDANGRGHIFLIDASGTITLTLDAVAGGRELTYDVQTRQLTVVGTGIVSNVALPAPASTPAPVIAVQPPTTPTATAPTVTAPTTEPTKPAAIAPAQPSAPAVEVVAPSLGLVPSGAREVWPGTYLVQLAQRPRLAVSDEDRIWMLDGQNYLSALHPRSGELYTQLAQLPASAQVAQMVVSPSHVFFTDVRAGLIYMFNISTERVTNIAAPFLPIATDIVASPDDRLWIGTTGIGLLSLDPQTQKLVSTEAEPSVSAVGTDPLGRIWLGLGSRQVIGLYDPLTNKVTELNLAHDGSVSAIAVDGGGTVWVGTDTGQLFAIRNQQLQGAAALGRRIDDLTIDARGQAWYLSRTDRELLYGLASGAGLTQHATPAASGPLFDRLGRAWLADGSTSGLFVSLTPGAQP